MLARGAFLAGAAIALTPIVLTYVSARRGENGSRGRDFRLSPEQKGTFMAPGEILAFPSEARAKARACDFEQQQRQLAHFNRQRLEPGLGEAPGPGAQALQRQMEMLEQEFVEAARRDVAAHLADVPRSAAAFIDWFEQLQQTGPGQGDPLFPWLAEHASLPQMRWFLAQELAGEAGFDDLVAMAQVKMPVRAKLEMARNYWDEMGRGDERGMHGPMLARLAQYLGIDADIDNTVPEALALANMMLALSFNRRYAFHAVGALGVVELTAPGRVALVARGLDRLGVPKKQSHYFTLHAVLDVRHAEAWNREVLYNLVAEDPRRAHPIAEGAVLRLWCGARCFARYRHYMPMSIGPKAAGLP
jgi:hypothetical protein